MNAVRKRFITGPNQYTRLTPKLETKNMPNSMATARVHLDRTRMGKPHADSQSVSALRRLHDSQIISDLKRSRSQTPEPFSVNKAPRSRTLHMDYTGQLPTPCTSGVQYFQIACWGHYIDIQPLTSLRAAQTTQALMASVNFFRKHGIILDTLRMDNQQSYDLRETARILKLHMEFIAPEVKKPNRAERAIRTAKNHIIATRAGFHPDCSHAYLDKCLPLSQHITAYTEKDSTLIITQ